MQFLEYPKWVEGRIVLNAEEEASWRAQADSLKQAIAEVAPAPVVEDEPELDSPLLPRQSRRKKAR